MVVFILFLYAGVSSALTYLTKPIVVSVFFFYILNLPSGIFSLVLETFRIVSLLCKRTFHAPQFSAPSSAVSSPGQCHPGLDQMKPYLDLA